jgi:RHS repeat-associated protein
VLGAAERAGFPASETTRKGFTGHEQVDGADVIHMNGRIYDPLTARFLQADPMVQGPYNGQSFNRYTYVFNNPLIYTDPTGYWGRREQAYLRSIVAIGITIWFPGFATQAFGLTGFQTTVLTGFLVGSVQTGTLKGGLQGAFSAALFHGVGTKFGGAHWSIRAAAHGVAGGIMAEVQGGRFGHGFASAGSAELLAPVVQHAEGTGPGEAIARMIVGGTASVASGGKFANGAVTAAFSYAFGQMATNRQEAAQARGEPDTVIERYQRNRSLRRAISVSCQADDCAIRLNLKVMADHTITDETFQYALNDIKEYWNTVAIHGDRTYGVEVNFSVVQKNPDLIIAATSAHVAGQAHLGFGRVLELGLYGSGTASHELGHLMGLGHRMNHTMSIMSYSDVRIVTGHDAAKLAELYGGRR